MKELSPPGHSFFFKSFITESYINLYGNVSRDIVKVKFVNEMLKVFHVDFSLANLQMMVVHLRRKQLSLLFNELNDKSCSTVTVASKLREVFKEGHIEVQFRVYSTIHLASSQAWLLYFRL